MYLHPLFFYHHNVQLPFWFFHSPDKHGLIIGIIKDHCIRPFPFDFGYENFRFHLLYGCFLSHREFPDIFGAKDPDAPHYQQESRPQLLRAEGSNWILIWTFQGVLA